MPTPFAPPPLTPPPASSWARVRRTSAGGGEGFSEMWGELRTPHISRSLLPSGEIQMRFGRTSGERGMALREWRERSSRHLSRFLLPSGDIQERFGWTSGERGMALAEWTEQRSPHLWTRRPSLRPRFHQPLSVSSEGGFSPNVTGETFLSRLGGSHFRLLHSSAQLLILSSQRGLKFEGWGEQGSPHPSKVSSPPPAGISCRRGRPHAGGGVWGGGDQMPTSAMRTS